MWVTVQASITHDIFLDETLLITRCHPRANRINQTTANVSLSGKSFFSQDDADIQWKFSRTRMWMPYLDEGNVMPPPFNLIPPPRVVINFCQRLLSVSFQTRHRTQWKFLRFQGRCSVISRVRFRHSCWTWVKPGFTFMGSVGSPARTAYLKKRLLVYR